MNDIASSQFPPSSTFQGRIFFYCCESGNQHLSVCLAEGLKQLGIPYYSNINYWRLSPERDDYLFQHHPSVTPDDCDVVIVEKIWLIHHRSLPENLFHSKRNYITLYLDDSDGLITPAWYPACRNFDFIFRTHCNSHIQYPDNFVPWVFGLSNRILKETHDIPNFQHRSRHLLVNFRVTQKQVIVRNFAGLDQLKPPPGLVVDPKHPDHLTVEHPLRLIFRDQLGPLLEKILPEYYIVDPFEQAPSDSYHYLQWVQTVQRHYPNYYQCLRTTAACAAFGGYLVPQRADGSEPYLEWWDSWRFWESLAAGCVTFHVDFDKYAAKLPVMPENWRHYIGIDLDNPEHTVERIASEPGILEQISQSGRQWAIENYGPVPTAIRVLETIGGSPSRSECGLLSSSHPLTCSLPVQLREINLIIFPDWSQDEDSLGLELAQVIREITTHPDKSQLTLLIDISNISEEDAELALSSVLMNLLMEEDLDVAEGPEIALIGKLSEIQWQALLPRLQTRIVLENENKQAIALLKAETIPSFELDRFSSERFKQRI
jgi:hypothetical protein